MTERNIRYELAEELTTKFFGILNRGEALACADFTLSDRKRILCDIEKPLKKYRARYSDMMWEVEKDTKYQPILAIDAALAKIAELKDGL
jgi:hypothetical protein